MNILKRIKWEKVVKVVVMLGVFACFTASASADVVHLKNGKTLVGEITEETDIYLTIKLKAVKAKLKISDVESVEKKELPEGFSEQEKSPPEEGASSEDLGMKGNLLSIISQLQESADRLEKSYTAQKGNFNKRRWKIWSDSWVAQSKIIEGRLRGVAQRNPQLFPQARKDVSNAFGLIMELHSGYSRELENSIKSHEASAAKNATPATAGPDTEMLSRLIRESLKKAVEEVNSNK